MIKGGIKVFTDIYGFKMTQEWLESKIIESEVVYLTGTNVEYAIHVEFGTSKMTAQPYLFPAAEAVFHEVESIWKEVNEDLPTLIRTIALRIEAYAKIRCPVDTGNLQSSIEAVQIS